MHLKSVVEFMKLLLLSTPSHTNMSKMLESEGVDAMVELSAAALKSRDLTYQRHAQQRSPTQHSEADGGDMS